MRDLIVPNDYLIKIDLKDAYYSIPLDPKSRRLMSFTWEGKTYEHLSLCFGLGPAPRIFTKITKVAVSILRKLGIRVVVYLDDFILMGQSLKEIQMARDTTLFLLQNLGFLINFEKSVLEPTHTLEYLGIMINSLNMTFSLPEDKSYHLINLCHQTIAAQNLTAHQLAKVIGKLIATMPAISPALIQVRSL